MSYMKIIKFYPTTYMFVGALVLLGVAVVPQLLAGEVLSWNAFGHILIKFFTEVGIALFIVGSITILLEVVDFQDYFLKRLTDIVIKDEYINRLDDTKKKELKQRIEEKLYFKGRSNDPESFFYTVQKHVAPLLDSYYYNSYEVRVQCWVDEEQGLIRKQFHRKIELANPGLLPIDFKLPIDCSMKELPEGVEPFKLNYVKVNNTPVDATCSKEAIKDEHYTVKYSCQNMIRCEKDQATIEIETESIVPIDDIHFSHRVPVPCKKYSITFHLYDNHRYELYGHGFGFMDGKNLEKQAFEDGMMLRFNDWILPGDGVIFTIVKKS